MSTVSPETLEPAIRLRGVSVGYGSHVILKDLTLDIRQGEIIFIGGGSGAGKTTLLSNLTTLNRPIAGEIWIGGIDVASAAEDALQSVRRQFGVMYQLGALFNSMTVLENVMLPMEEFTNLPREAREEVARAKLGLVDLASAAAKMPSELSGGMQKRAAIARALALDAPIIFLDEPSAGLDPMTSADLDSLIQTLNETLGVTFVIISHELASIFAIAHRFAMIDGKRGGLVEVGDPRVMRDSSSDPLVRKFLNRQGVAIHSAPAPH
ncbi:MAG: ATP-binding cassette domain-containing protein [Planctomycetota bacterium]|nr:MAG: ATP-binding cassette domain-containing protein [Planctomycetota bacterium]RLS94914.1 MAG: ATP-binding cassette domain-containing protein [Planctomycetota bacterium]